MKLWLRLIAAYARMLTSPAPATSDVWASRARDVEDAHQALGHRFYDWRRYGGQWHHFVRVETQSELRAVEEWAARGGRRP